MRNIGILGAMAQEIDEVKALLTEKTVVKIANREFVVGKIGNVRCVVAFSKWGKVAATITATLLIQEFAVTDLIFIGTAGALADGLKVGDIVVSKRLVQHDLDARPIISRFELPLLNRVYVDSDPDLTALAGRAVSNLINKGVESSSTSIRLCILVTLPAATSSSTVLKNGMKYCPCCQMYNVLRWKAQPWRKSVWSLARPSPSSAPSATPPTTTPALILGSSSSRWPMRIRGLLSKR